MAKAKAKSGSSSVKIVFSKKKKVKLKKATDLTLKSQRSTEDKGVNPLK